MQEHISKNFTFKEFEDSVKAKENNIDNSIPSDIVRKAITSLVITVLQPLRDAWGKPLGLSSGYRCPELNKIVGGRSTSQHLKGEAADVLTKSPFDLASLAVELSLPFDQMILYPTFVHFSHKLNGPQRGYVGYDETYKGKRLINL